MTELYRVRSEFHDIAVEEDDDVISLRFNGRLQSALSTDGSLDSPQPYLGRLHLILAVNPHAASVLVIGLGGGVLPIRMWRDYPEMRVDVVELDPVVVDVSRRYFGLPDDERLRVVVDDGRAYLERTSERYDAIVVDAYFETAMPFALATREFVALAAARLNDRGVLAYNVVGIPVGPGSDAFKRFIAGVASVLPEVTLSSVGVDCGGGRQNVIVLASKTAVPLSELRDRVRDRVGGQVGVSGFEGFADSLVRVETPVDEVAFSDSDAPPDGLLRV